MERVQGIGGLFFKAIDKPALLAWYRDNLGIDVQDWGGAVFNWREMNPTGDATTHWSVFSSDTTYLAPGTASFMVNFRVADLAAMLSQLRANGCNVDDSVEDTEYGRFGWVIDPEGNKIELWQPPT
jgi:predicted enzyme related to lactoylglutathione lyase